MEDAGDGAGVAAFRVDQMDAGSGFVDIEKLCAPGKVRPVVDVAFCGHVMVERNGVILCWGGTKEDTDSYVATNKIFVFLPQFNRNDFPFWFTANCRLGDVPEERSGSSGVLIGSTLLIFGGYKKGDEIADPDVHGFVMPGHWTNDLYMLDLVEGKWTKKTYDKSERRPAPRDKMCAWEYRGSAYFFGGYGYGICDTLYRQTPGPGPFLKEGAFRINAEASLLVDYAWNNQLLMFDGVSFSLVCQGGCIPSPRAAAASSRRGAFVYVFGGRSGGTRMNDLYRLDLSSFIWTQVETSNGPVGRSWASLDIVGPGRLLVWGGLSNTGEPCSDLWMVDGCGGPWRRRANYLNHRYWHTSCLVDGTLFVVGGRSLALERRANRGEGGNEEDEGEDSDDEEDEHQERLPRQIECMQVSPPSLKVLSLNAVPCGYVPDCVPVHIQWLLRMHSFLQSDYSQCKWVRGLTLTDLLNYGSLST